VTTAQATSEARQVFDRFYNRELPIIGAYPAPSSVSGINYGVSYFADRSVLLTLNGKPYFVFDGERTYYRDTIEHAARCLGNFGQAKIAAMLQAKHAGEAIAWIDGVCWNVETGELVDVA
jgi:hypothetical protein